MQFIKGVITRIGAILAAPETEWMVIAAEPDWPVPRYVAILGLIPALSRFAGASLVGWYAPVVPSLGGALVIYLSSFAVVYVVAFAIDVLAPRFAGQRNFAGALKLAVYAATPVWLAGLFLVVPGLSFLMIFGLYAVYLVWCGLPILMRAPPQAALLYTTAISLVVLIAICAFGLMEAPLFGPS